jgi:hypothetical protein
MASRVSGGAGAPRERPTAVGDARRRGRAPRLSRPLELTTAPSPLRRPRRPSARAAEEQRAVDETAREAAAKVVLTAEDESVFRACCFASPAWLARALLTPAASGSALPPLEAAP